MNIKNIFLDFKRKFVLLDTRTLCLILALLGLGVAGLANILYRPSYREGPIGSIVGFIIFFIWGFMGLVIVLRKEAPFLLFPFERSGIGAIIYGSIIMMISWGIALFMLVFFLTKGFV